MGCQPHGDSQRLGEVRTYEPSRRRSPGNVGSGGCSHICHAGADTTFQAPNEKLGAAWIGLKYINTHTRSISYCPSDVEGSHHGHPFEAHPVLLNLPTVDDQAVHDEYDSRKAQTCIHRCSPRPQVTFSKYWVESNIYAHSSEDCNLKISQFYNAHCFGLLERD
ncbi:hypothetical protein ONS96_002220 [Cadophora gregata f. sp. sojae]|nr:hypothetical protein ONS96_002220 [Cadophora gregata f. sp. sojae]